MNRAKEAAEIAWKLVGTGVYQLGTGDCDTPENGPSDCAGFAINKCYNIRRHRPGFNVGPWASVSDDINCNSAIEDANHHQELFEIITKPEIGCLLTYPTFRIKGIRSWSSGTHEFISHQEKEAVHNYIGHVGIVIAVPAEWHKATSGYGSLTVVQCCGPNGRRPGIIMTNGSHWDKHDDIWPKPEHRTTMLRVRPATWLNPATNKFRQTSDVIACCAYAMGAEGGNKCKDCR